MALNKLILLIIAMLIIGAIWDSERIAAPHLEHGRITVVYWEKWTSFEAETMQSVVDAFNNSQSKITVKMLNISGVGEKTLLAVAGGDPPDIAGLWGANVAQYADDHAVLPLEGMCKQYGIDASRYIPVYWGMCNYNGHVYALPSAPHSTALHYNRDLFIAAGLDPDRPLEPLQACST